MCNQFRALKDWSEIPRKLAQARLNFDYNPNVAPTELVPAFLAERATPLATQITALESTWLLLEARSVRRL